MSVVDNRLFDLLPEARESAPGVTAIGYESLPPKGKQGSSLTMLEFAADGGGVMPRIFGVNHHPEVRDSRRQRRILEQKMTRGEVSREWFEERIRILRDGFSSPEAEQRIMLTSEYTFLSPMRFHMYRQIRLRLANYGWTVPLHEDQVLSRPNGPGGL